MPEKQKASHRTTTRILDLFELVAAAEDGISFTKIATELNMPKSSLHPILHTLADRKYLRFSEKLQTYFIGEAFLAFTQSYRKTYNILDKIKDVLSGMSDIVDETSFFGILSGGNIQYLLKAECKNPIRIVTAQAGTINPAYSTALGKAVLSGYSLDALTRLYGENLAKVTPHTVTDLTELSRQISSIKQTGFAFEREESTIGIQCVAVPIMHKDNVIAAMSSAVPIYRYTPQKEAEIKKALLDSKEEVENIIKNNYSSWIY